jgi:cytochrome c oxidase cbb3-type subunit 3
MHQRKDTLAMNNEPEKQVRVLDHDADGIQELDNLLPRWWVWLFWLCNVFGLGYMLYFHVFNLGDLQAAAYVKEARAGEELKSAALASFEADLSNLQPLSEGGVLESGLRLYTTYCAPCHRHDAGGLVGPNLCDDYWIHGAGYLDSVKTIINGVPEKGMLAWRGVLKPHEIQAVASYIYTLRGSSPPNPKPPENLAPTSSNQPSEFE